MAGMPTGGPGFGEVVGGVDTMLGWFTGSKTSTNQNGTQVLNGTQVQEEEVSLDKANELMRSLLENNNGLASLLQGEKGAGLYNSTVNQQLVGDLLARTVGQVAALSSKKTATQNSTTDNTQTNTAKKKGALQWIVCTELYKQGKMPHKHYRYGARVFAAYKEHHKPGYYIWAIPAVMHLRKHPDSALSKVLGIIFRARAEHISAVAGCKEAKRSVLGAVTTHGLYVICVALSYTIARKPIDFMSAVYPTLEN